MGAVTRTRAGFASRCLLLGVSTLLSGAILAGASAESAEAHAAFLESKPQPGARLTAGPRTIRLEFTEPVNRRLTTATLTELPSGETIPTAMGAGEKGELLLRPAARLRRAAFRVNWHTVSTEDGHALEGSIAFGVGTAATGSSQELEQSPLARGGWLRIALRAFLYAGLFFFAGGVFCSILLSRGKAPDGWLVPESLGPALERVGLDRALLAA
ncbi:MAG: copper resistance protein CopC, partial [Actinomycetota bacterium]|nr:copper resistance protein CopC [Actinomycetota bacterium]